MIDFEFKKKFGQNFISDKNLLSAIVSDAGVTGQDEVLEVGAGAGALTEILSERAKKVVSFEIDKDLESHLLALKLKNVKFVFEDFMKANLAQVEKEFSAKYKVVANLPYYITTPIIFKFLEEATRLESLTIMVQKEVAERICANFGGKEYGVLTVMINFYGEPKIVRNISRNMFYPAPNVDSALVRIDLREKFPNIDKKAFFRFVQTCFSMRRKTLLNNLSQNFSKEELKEKLGEQTLKKRAETLSPEEFVELFKKLN